MDEVDGMGAGDRSGMSELIQMIKNSRVPIICICNDRQSQKLKSLANYCLDMRFSRPQKPIIAKRAIAIAQKEGLTVEYNAAEALAESCGNDIRQVINCLQMWASDNRGQSKMSYKALKDREHTLNKDESLRVNLFDATKTILEGRAGLANATPKAELDSFFKRNEAYFTDYQFVGLLVQENYLKIVQGKYNEAKRSGDQTKVLGALEQMSAAAESESDFAYAENALREGQNWSLLPFTAMLTVKTGYHAGGESGGFFPGYPTFTAWLGKNSSRNKTTRLLQELVHHANYHISGGTEEMRLSYLPVFRTHFHASLVSKNNGSDSEGLSEAIQLMDEYGFDRDDLFEKFDEFSLPIAASAGGKSKQQQAVSLKDGMDSKQKAAFTRAYNAGVHKSQALVAEQGAAVGRKPKRQASSMSDTKDPDAIDDDHDAVQEDDEDDKDEEELDAAKVQAMFKKKGGGRKKTAASGVAKGKGKATNRKKK